ncbi:MAG TPA: hypothetical protein VF762_24065, partial [Blastocatellia bacterium]
TGKYLCDIPSPGLAQHGLHPGHLRDEVRLPAHAFTGEILPVFCLVINQNGIGLASSGALKYSFIHLSSGAAGEPLAKNFDHPRREKTRCQSQTTKNRKKPKPTVLLRPQMKPVKCRRNAHNSKFITLFTKKQSKAGMQPRTQRCIAASFR